jgi:soluble lytic murein transglycosylase
LVAALMLASTLAGWGGAASSASAETLSPEDQNLYRQGFAAAEEGKLDYARALAHKAADKTLLPVLAWAAYEKIGSGATFEQIAGFVGSHPNWPHIPLLIRRAEEAISAATPNDVLRPWFEVHAPETAEGAMAWGRVLQDDGKAEAATAILRHAWIYNSFGPTQEREFLTHFASVIRPEDDFARLDRLLWDHQDEAATLQMRRVPEGAKRLARARMALAHDNSRGEALAGLVFEADRHDPGLIYELVNFRRERGHEDEAIPLLKDPGADRGRPELWWAERAALARYALQQGHITAAYEIARDHGAIEGVPYAEAEWLAGWIALRFLHEAQVAQTHFTKLYDHVITPLGHARGAYWSARAFEAAGDLRAADHWYRLAADNGTAFYGQLAVARSGGSGASALTGDPVPSAEEVEAFKKNDLAHMARLLGEIGQFDLMRVFLVQLIENEHSPGIRAQAAALPTEFGRADIAIVVAHQSERMGLPLIASGYPIPSIPSADREKPEKALVLGLIRQESGFHRDAVSSAGARGLMQLMPATAAKIAHAIKLVFKRKDTLDTALTHDPSLNLRLGTVYLDDLLGQFGGSYILAVAAYNAGPARVQKWMRDFGDPRTPGVDAVDWIESIPFSETRNYVQRVLEGVQVYRLRLGTTSVALSLESDLKR